MLQFEGLIVFIVCIVVDGFPIYLGSRALMALLKRSLAVANNYLSLSDMKLVPAPNTTFLLAQTLCT